MVTVTTKSKHKSVRAITTVLVGTVKGKEFLGKVIYFLGPEARRGKWEGRIVLQAGRKHSIRKA